MKHIVTDIQRFCMHDGPGIRTTVFLKGCPLNCFWCHNPETKSALPQLMYHKSKCIGCMGCLSCENGVHYEERGEHRLCFSKCVACGKCSEACPTGAISIVGRAMDSGEIVEAALRDRAFYGKEGGLTVSGGEPMLNPEACLELLRMARERGLRTAVETCGYFPKEYVKPLCENVDMLLWDVKDTDDERHRRNVGVSNALILENLRYADTLGVPIVLRCIMLKGINLDDEHLNRLGELYASLKNAVRVDILPCHSLGGSKGEAIGATPARLSAFEPSREEVAYAVERVNAFKYLAD